MYYTQRFIHYPVGVSHSIIILLPGLASILSSIEVNSPTHSLFWAFRRGIKHKFTPAMTLAGSQHSLVQRGYRIPNIRACPPGSIPLLGKSIPANYLTHR